MKNFTVNPEYLTITLMADESLEMDRDFTPTADMLVHEFDDEATLDEEEEIEPIDSQLLELADLQRVNCIY